MAPRLDLDNTQGLLARAYRGLTYARFTAEFGEGMAGPDRSCFLGEVEDSGPRFWDWGAPQEPPVDGLVLLYAAPPEILDRRQAELADCLAAAGIRDVTVLDTLELG